MITGDGSRRDTEGVYGRVPVHTSHSQSCPLGSDCDINLSKKDMKYQSLLQPQRTVSPARTAVHRSIPPTARTGVSGLISRYTTDPHSIVMDKTKWFKQQHLLHAIDFWTTKVKSYQMIPFRL